jgi:putative addiction module component (TIGR02574 family)
MEKAMDRTLLEGILRLKPAERFRLLKVIYESLDRPDAEIDEVWYDEAERRLAAIDAGNLNCVPAEKVIGKRP